MFGTGLTVQSNTLNIIQLISHAEKGSRLGTVFNTIVCNLKEAEVSNLREIIRQSAVERLRTEKAIADNNFLTVSVRHCGSYWMCRP